jgi:hypothetical protein
MTRWKKAFRYLWRVNAILILVAAGAVTFGVVVYLVSEVAGRAAVRREAEAAPAVASAKADFRTSLSQPSFVAGTAVMRAQLYRLNGGGAFSSGSSEIRNLLFIQPGEKSARWLLGDDRHVIETTDLAEGDNYSSARRTVATAVLVKPAEGDRDVSGGKVLLVDPPGRRIVDAAVGVRKIQMAVLRSDEITLLYERDRRLVLATFDAGTFARRGEQEIEVPLLK